MSDPSQGPWEQLTPAEQARARKMIAIGIDLLVADIAYELLIDPEHAEALFDSR